MMGMNHCIAGGCGHLGLAIAELGAKRIKKVRLNESEGEIREGLLREMKENQY